MPPFKGSRYAGLDRTKIIGASGRSKTLLHLREMLNSETVSDPESRAHTVVQGDELDGLAFKYAGTENAWWVIAEINDIQNPFELTEGTVLVIPSKEIFRRILA